jgi:hypothetical protein
LHCIHCKRLQTLQRTIVPSSSAHAFLPVGLLEPEDEGTIIIWSTGNY